MYNLLKLVHVLAVIVWFGGGIMVIILGGVAARKDAQTLAGVSSALATTGKVFGPAAGVALLAGIGMLLVPNSAFDFSEPWIGIGFLVWFISAFLGSRIIGPGWERMADLTATGDAAAIQAQRSKLTAPTMADASLLLVAVSAMVFKWGT